MKKIISKLKHTFGIFDGNGIQVKKCFIMYFMLVTIIYGIYLISTNDEKDPVIYEIITYPRLNKYLINTTTCKIPDLDPFNEDVLPFIKKEDYRSCRKLDLLTYVDKSDGLPVLRINNSLLSSYSHFTISCCYSNITRINFEVEVDDEVRCYISECENLSNTTYNPEWLNQFVPFSEKSPSSCLRYASTDNSICSEKNILKNKTIKCNEFVYRRKETNIIHDFNITCQENLWKLTIIGTLNVIGELVSLSYGGFISDKYGRKYLLIFSLLASTCIGILRSFSVNYIMYAALEFFDTALGGGTYGAAFILGMEIVGPTQRNVANAIISCIYATGQAILGIAAWLSPSWRFMLRTLYIPGVISLTFSRTVPESVRWLLSVNKKEKARKIILRMADDDKKQITNELFDRVLNTDINMEEDLETSVQETFCDAVKNKELLLRLVHCSFTWICSAFVYYGLTIHSVSLSENTYLSFIFSVMVEIPAYIIYYYGNEKIGRRLMVAVSLILGGISCLAVGLISEEWFWLQLASFLTGKCCATIAYTILYVYTTEMFPTTTRHSMFSICSMFGRIGSMIAPQVPLLARISKMLPLLMFGALATLSGCLSFFFPETLNTKLPGTIEEAVNIGKSNRHYKSLKMLFKRR